MGRSRKLSKSSNLFLNHYLDPLLLPEDICKLCDISLATFYNYEKELNLPRLRVAIGHSNANLPLKKAIKSFSDEDECMELEILKKIAFFMKARIKLIPTMNDLHSPQYAVKSKDVDFAMASISWTPELAKDLYFSHTYLFDDGPSGVLMAIKNKKPLSGRKSKPDLGVPLHSIHALHAFQFMQSDFNVRTFRSPQKTFQSLQNGLVDYILMHPVWLKTFPTESAGIEICSKSHSYNSFTGLLFHSDSQHLRDPINKAIEMVHEKTTLGKNLSKA